MLVLMLGRLFPNLTMDELVHLERRVADRCIAGRQVQVRRRLCQAVRPSMRRIVVLQAGRPCIFMRPVAVVVQGVVVLVGPTEALVAEVKAVNMGVM